MPTRPFFLVLSSGLPGCGKTTLARRLAQVTRAPLFAKDRLQSALRRDALAERSGPEGYRLILDLAQEQLSLGISTVLDGVFPKTGFRTEAEGTARLHGAQFRPIFCHCSDEALWRARMQARIQYVPDWTPVGWEEALRLREDFEAWQAVMGSQAHRRFSGPTLPVDNVSYADGARVRASIRSAVGICLPGRQPDRLQHGQDHHHRFRQLCRAAHLPGRTGGCLPSPKHHGRGISTKPLRAVGYARQPVEYCADRWHDAYSGALFDGSAWDRGGESGYRVARGGSWHEPLINCQCATRLRVNEKKRDDLYGFRAALTITE